MAEQRAHAQEFSFGPGLGGVEGARLFDVVRDPEGERGAPVLAATARERESAVGNRRFLLRAVEYLTGLGVGRFIDVGVSGAGPIYPAGAQVVRSGDVHRVLADPAVPALLGDGEPVGLALVGVLDRLPDQGRACGLVRRLTAALPDGSYLILTHRAAEGGRAGQAGWDAHPRSRERVAAFFTGLEMVAPGLVWAERWRPHLRDLRTDTGCYAGVARKP